MGNVEELEYSSFEKFYIDILPNGKLGKNLQGYIFRGESDSEYTLIPSALRPDGREKILKLSGFELKDECDFKYIFEESNAVLNFYNTANINGLYIPNIEELCKFTDKCMSISSLAIIDKKWIPEKLFELFALAQHYGVPTRLIDWTFDIYVALYFAVMKILKKVAKGEQVRSNKKFVLWMLNAKFFSSFQTEPIPLKIIVPPYRNNQNLSAQKGVLTCLSQSVNMNNTNCNILNTKPLDEQIRNESLRDDLEMKPHLYRILFPYSEVFCVVKYLQQFGYSYARIFPGHSSIVEDLLEKNYGERLTSAMGRLSPANLFSFVQPRPTKNFEIFSFLGYLCGYQMKNATKNSINSISFANNIYPLGDAKEIQGLRVKSKSFFHCGANLPHPMPHRFGKVSYIFFGPGKRGITRETMV